MASAETHAMATVPGRSSPDTMSNEEFEHSRNARKKHFRILTAWGGSNTKEDGGDSVRGSEDRAPPKQTEDYGDMTRSDMNEELSILDFANSRPTKLAVNGPHTPIKSSTPSIVDARPSTSGPDLTHSPAAPARRDIHIPTRTSSGNTRKAQSRRYDSLNDYGSSLPSTPEPVEQSSAGSYMSHETSNSSIFTLPPLQLKGAHEEWGRLETLVEDEQGSYDLVVPQEQSTMHSFTLETRAELMFSREHLAEIFKDPAQLHRFTSFLSASRPQSLSILIYYLDAVKALRAIDYANAVADALEPISDLGFTDTPARPTVNSVLEDKARKAFELLVREDLPAYIAHVFVQIASLSVRRRVSGKLSQNLREASEGLAEVFCLTDPSRPDNPIVFASEEFHRTTQYGMGYALGRNCRFLQGPKTDDNSVRRLATAIREGREITELILNYRRDGSPFMNLLSMAPLLDSRGNVRYFIGAQVDVSGLVKNCTDLKGLKRLVAEENRRNGHDSEPSQQEPTTSDEEEAEHDAADEFQKLCEMFNIGELEAVKRYGGRMHKEPIHAEEPDTGPGLSRLSSRPRLLLKERSPDLFTSNQLHTRSNGRLAGVYENYLLIRPHPSTRILFASPSLRVPGMLQSSFMDRVGGSARVRDELTNALSEGRGVTAKVRWLTSRIAGNGSSNELGRPRWIHCTPMIGMDKKIGVWMVILVDEDEHHASHHPQRALGVVRVAPPVEDLDVSWRGERRENGRDMRRPRDPRSERRADTSSEETVKEDQEDDSVRISANGRTSSMKSSGTPAPPPVVSSGRTGTSFSRPLFKESDRA